jgi:hypothetical protein
MVKKNRLHIYNNYTSPKKVLVVKSIPANSFICIQPDSFF